MRKFEASREALVVNKVWQVYIEVNLKEAELHRWVWTLKKQEAKFDLLFLNRNYMKYTHKTSFEG